MKQGTEPSKLLIQEIFIDLEKNVELYRSDVYEPFTDDIGRLYKLLAKEYGRCVGKVYLDTKSRGTIAVGWVFQKRMPYENKPSLTYMREVWVHLYEECEIDDPDHLERRTSHGVEHVRFKHKIIGRGS